MNAYQQYQQFCKNHAKDSETNFFNALMKEFNVSYDTALDIWYAPQRSWFRSEMMEAIIALDKLEPGEFIPCFASGEFKWDAVNKKFLPQEN